MSQKNFQSRKKFLNAMLRLALPQNNDFIAFKIRWKNNKICIGRVIVILLDRDHELDVIIRKSVPHTCGNMWQVNREDIVKVFQQIKEKSSS